MLNPNSTHIERAAKIMGWKPAGIGSWWIFEGGQSYCMSTPWKGLTAEGLVAIEDRLREADWASWLSRDDDKVWHVWKNGGERWHDERTISGSTRESAALAALLASESK